MRFLSEQPCDSYHGVTKIYHMHAFVCSPVSFWRQESQGEGSSRRVCGESACGPVRRGESSVCMVERAWLDHCRPLGTELLGRPILSTSHQVSALLDSSGQCVSSDHSSHPENLN